MARTLIPAEEMKVNSVITAPLAFVAADATNGMYLSTTHYADTWFHVKNTGAAAVNVTVRSRSGETAADLVVTVAATNGEALIGPFDDSMYENLDETIHVDFSTSAGVTIKAYQRPENL